MNVIEEKYENIITRVRSLCGETRDFSVSVSIRVHQGSTLSPCLLFLVMDEITKYILVGYHIVHTVCRFRGGRREFYGSEQLT